jgi:hypothetical protein
VIRPPNFDSARKYPVKFLIHGGPQGAWGDAWSYRWNPELMAASGYVVVMVNPRGSTGYGQAFIDGVNGDWGGKAYVDLMKGLDYAEVHYPFIDKTRECALGASYGGYMADWILTHTDLFCVHRDARWDVQSAERVRRYGRALVQRVGVPAACVCCDEGTCGGCRGWAGAAVEICGRADCGGSFPEVVTDAFDPECEDAHAGDSFATGLPAGCVGGDAVVYGAAAAECAEPDALFSG